MEGGGGVQWLSSNIRETAEICLPISQNKPEFSFLEAQFLYNYIDVKDSLPHSLKGRLALLAISPLFVDRYGSS